MLLPSTTLKRYIFEYVVHFAQNQEGEINLFRAFVPRVLRGDPPQTVRKVLASLYFKQWSKVKVVTDHQKGKQSFLQKERLQFEK